MTWKGYGLVVRHGVTQWDATSGASRPPDRVTGWLDLPLRHEGVTEVQHAAQAIGSFPIDLIVSSTLARTMQTAKAIQGRHPRVQILPSPQLRAWNTGIYSGHLQTDVQQPLNYAVSHPQTPIPMGESFAQFVARFLPFAWKLIEDPRLLCLVTHGMNVEVLGQYARTGQTKFTTYASTETKPGEAIFITPNGIQEIAA